MTQSRQDIAALEAQRRTAMMAADVRTLDTLFADDLVWIHATARADTKQGLLAAIQSGKTKYLSMDVTDGSLRFYGDTAIVSGIVNMQAEINGEVRPVENRFTIIWVRAGESWRVVNWQSTAVRKPA